MYITPSVVMLSIANCPFLTARLVLRGCFLGEYPLSFAASVGQRETCELLLKIHEDQNKRMLELARAFYSNTEEIAGKLFTGGESRKLTKGCSVLGAKLVTKAAVRKFRGDRDVWKTKKEQENIKKLQEKAAANPLMTLEMPKAEKNGAEKNEAEKNESNDAYIDHLNSKFLNQESSQGDTALHMAVRYGHLKVIDWLLGDKAKDSMHVQKPPSSR